MQKIRQRDYEAYPGDQGSAAGLTGRQLAAVEILAALAPYAVKGRYADTARKAVELADALWDVLEAGRLATDVSSMLDLDALEAERPGEDGSDGTF